MAHVARLAWRATPMPRSVLPIATIGQNGREFCSGYRESFPLWSGILSISLTRCIFECAFARPVHAIRVFPVLFHRKFL
jgi:hypothetical protein